jgi:transposase
MYTHNPTDEDFHEQFENSYYPRFYLIESTPQGSGYIGRTILSTLTSRQDANKFRSMVLPVLIDRVKPLLQDFFSEHLQTTPENFEKAIKVMKDLKVNSLFRDKITQSPTVSDFKKQFFNY